MPEPTPANTLDRMRRQVRAVRWRRNLHELQRALYHLIATLAGGAATLVVLALRTAPGPFAAATWAVAAATLLLAGWLARALVRRWLSPARAPLWIDRRTGLEGRLATALELGHQGAVRAPFFPLLVEDNARRLPTWRPERLLPDGLPSGAFAGALAAVGVFLLVLLLAPWLRPGAAPVTSSEVTGDEPVRGHIVIARRARRQAGESVLAPFAEPVEDDERSALSRLPDALQERIQARLWGEDREPARRAMELAERGGAPGPGGGSPPADRLVDTSEAEERWAVVRKAPRGARPAPGAAAAASPGETPTDGGATPAAAGERGAERGGEAGAHQAAAGAGTGSDPNLFGAASAARAARERFDLPLAARVRAQSGAPEAPSPGEAPAPAPDSHPDLGERQRRDAPVPRMRVPPIYEAAVRAVFAHRASEEAP